MPARQNVWELTEQLKRNLSNPTKTRENDVVGKLCDDKRSQHVLTNGQSPGTDTNGGEKSLLAPETGTKNDLVTPEKKDLVAYNNYNVLPVVIQTECNIDDRSMVLGTETLAEKVGNTTETSPLGRCASVEGSSVVQKSQPDQDTQVVEVQKYLPSSLTLKSSESTHCEPNMTCTSYEHSKSVPVTTKLPRSIEEKTSDESTKVIVIDDSDGEEEDGDEEVKLISSNVVDLWSKFDLIELDHVKIPCVYRNSVQYVAFHMVSTKLLAKFVKVAELGDMHVQRYEMTEEEASVLNSINTQSCSKEVGEHRYLAGNLLVKFLDFKAFYLKLKRQYQSYCVKTGWYRVNDCTNTPYVERHGVRYVPLSVMRQAAKLLTQRDRVDTVQVDDGELLSLNRECLGIHTFGPSIRLVSVNIIQNHSNCKKIVELSENPYKSIVDEQESNTAPCMLGTKANVKAGDINIQVGGKLVKQPVINESKVSDTSISPLPVTTALSQSSVGTSVPDVLSSQRKCTPVTSLTPSTTERISSSTDTSPHPLKMLHAPPTFDQAIKDRQVEESTMPLDLSCQYATSSEPSSVSGSHTSATCVSNSVNQQNQDRCPDVHPLHPQEHQKPYMPVLPLHSGSDTRQPFPVSQPFQRFPKPDMPTIHHFPSSNQLDQASVPQRFYAPHLPQTYRPYHRPRVPFQPSLEDLQRLNPSIHPQEQRAAYYNHAPHQALLMQRHPFSASLGSLAAVNQPRPEFHNRLPSWMQRRYPNSVNAYYALPQSSDHEALKRLSNHQSVSTCSTPTVSTPSEMRAPPPPYPYPQQLLSSSDASRMQPHRVENEPGCIRASPPVRFQAGNCGYECNITRAKNDSGNTLTGSTTAQRDRLICDADRISSLPHPAVQSSLMGSAEVQPPFGSSEAVLPSGRYPVINVSSAVGRSAGTFTPSTSLSSSTWHSGSRKHRKGRNVLTLPITSAQAPNGFSDAPPIPKSTTGQTAFAPAQSKDFVKGNELGKASTFLVVPDSNPTSTMSRKFLPKDVKDNDIHVRILDLFNRLVPVLHSLWRGNKEWFISVEELCITFFPHVRFTELEYTLHSVLRTDCMRMTSMEEKALCNYYGIPEGILRSKFILPLTTFKMIFHSLHQIFGESALQELKEFLESRKVAEEAGATHPAESGKANKTTGSAKRKATRPSKETTLNSPNELSSRSRKRKSIQPHKVDVASKCIKDVSNVISNLSTVEDGKLSEMSVSHPGQKENCSERSPTLLSIPRDQTKKTNEHHSDLHKLNYPLCVDLEGQAVKSSYDSVCEANSQTSGHDSSQETIGFAEDDDEDSFCITISDVVSLKNNPMFINSLESSSELHDTHNIAIQDQ